MKLSEHLGKITWSLADKLLYVGYGFVQFMQINALHSGNMGDHDLATTTYGMFTLIVTLNTWVTMIADGSALAGIIQFGVHKEDRKRVNMLAVMIYGAIVAFAGLLFYGLAGVIEHSLHIDGFPVVAAWLPIYLILTMPRMICLKILLRDMGMRQIFIADAVWFGVRTLMTVMAMNANSLVRLEDILMIDLVGMGACSLVMLILTWRQLEFSWSGSMSLGRYLKYGVPLSLAGALSTAPRMLDVYVIAMFFGVGVVGIYNPAKNLYRIFEQAYDAVVTLLYPAAVRMFSQNRMSDLQILITKAISFTLLPTLVAVVVLELGLGEFLIDMLLPQYHEVVGHFNVLTIAALAMPFGLMAGVIQAMGRSTPLLVYSAMSVVASMAVLFIVGYSGNPDWIGLGLVTFTVVSGALYMNHVRKEIHIPLKALTRALDDVRVSLSGRMKGKQ
jgi:O-antigen/teichoic acid export membrane protein